MIELEVEQDLKDKMTVKFDEVLSLLQSHLKLDRDRALEQLKESLQEHQGSENIIASLRTKILGYVASPATSSWETRQGGLLGAKVIIACKFGGESFMEEMRVQALRLTHDEEARVRQAAGRHLE